MVGSEMQTIGGSVHPGLIEVGGIGSLHARNVLAGKVPGSTLAAVIANEEFLRAKVASRF